YYHRTLGPDGLVRILHCRGQVVADEKGNVIKMFGTAQDVTELKQMEETIRRQAYHDALTGLPNRILFIDHLDFALSQAHRSGKKLAVMFLDLDRFKTINDSLGHALGDKLLIAVAHRLKASVREADMIARMGGDEYTILLSQVNHEEDIVTIVEKIIAAFKQPYSIDSRELHITVSIGISIYPNDGDDAGILMQNADTAMYHAKEEGRNNYQFYNPVINVKAFRKIVLEHGLRHTLQQEELTVHYQPLVNIGTGKITGMEALVRWRHPDLGLLTPLQFIPLAEETGLITAIDEWVLRTACAQNKAWQNAGYAPLCVTVNLSAHHLQHTNLVKTVDEVLRDTSLDPRFLCIEITESTIMQNIEAAAYKLSALNELGVRCAIDDFGIGYSSLSYLKKLPIHKLKIDKSFISDLLIDTDNKAIVHAIIVLAHNLKIKVVAEGVEYEDQRSFLQAMRCDEMQGYLSGQPLPPEEFERLIACSP
ncbi:MAG: EAL domain-containing protein, partial [Nitrospirota bacterium]